MKPAALAKSLFPGLAARYLAKRALLEQTERAFEAAKSSRFRKRPTGTQSPDAAVNQAGDYLRKWARHLDENNDLAIGILNVLVDRIVSTGLTVTPMVKQRNGKPAERINKQLREAWETWTKRPEVTGELPFSEVQRLVCRAWLRDGEALVQMVRGNMASLEHLGGVPYSLELIEADMLPMELVDQKDDIIHGVQKNAWGRPVVYHLLKQHPGDLLSGLQVASLKNTKPVPADNILHIKFSRRFRQTRGVTIFHGVITRLDDIADYEQSERIAARVAAAFTGAITKSPDAPPQTNSAGDRTFTMEPGMIFDSLLPGESVETISSNRPNSALQEFRNSQLRAVAGGTGTSYSSISKDYSGTYSSQRQELVESGPGYSRMRDYFVSAFLLPVYEGFVEMAVASGAIQSRGLPLEDLVAADFGGVAVPWIDPKKEVDADRLAVEAGFKSRYMVMRERGYDPTIVDEQREQDTQAPAQQPAPVASGSPGELPNNETDENDDEAAA